MADNTPGALQPSRDLLTLQGPFALCPRDPPPFQRSHMSYFSTLDRWFPILYENKCLSKNLKHKVLSTLMTIMD